jgi:hypothetical protein
MDPRIIQASFRIQHNHDDGSLGEMVEDRSHHAPADHDPEADWQRERVFRCTSCAESMTILADDRGVARSGH